MGSVSAQSQKILYTSTLFGSERLIQCLVDEHYRRSSTSYGLLCRTSFAQHLGPKKTSTSCHTLTNLVSTICVSSDGSSSSRANLIDPEGYGDKLPPSLKTWLVDSKGFLKRGQQTRVALGPNNSFFAWDTDSIRWSNIPPGLEEDIQEWLSPSGWLKGPPRIVDLGANGTYFAISEYGSPSVSNKPEGLLKQLLAWIGDDDFSYDKIAVSSFLIDT